MTWAHELRNTPRRRGTRRLLFFLQYQHTLPDNSLSITSPILKSQKWMPSSINQWLTPSPWKTRGSLCRLTSKRSWTSGTSSSSSSLRLPSSTRKIESSQASYSPHSTVIPYLLIGLDESPELLVEETNTARNELLDTRGQYILRNRVVESVLSANPILKAVHNGTDASPVER